MAWYRVECHGDVRELYTVEADSEQEAMDKWATGDLFLSEASSVEAVSATLEDD